LFGGRLRGAFAPLFYFFPLSFEGEARLPRLDGQGDTGGEVDETIIFSLDNVKSQWG